MDTPVSKHLHPDGTAMSTPIGRIQLRARADRFRRNCAPPLGCSRRAWSGFTDAATPAPGRMCGRPIVGGQRPPHSGAWM